jgi:hypothetical protein
MASEMKSQNIACGIIRLENGPARKLVMESP